MRTLIAIVRGLYLGLSALELISGIYFASFVGSFALILMATFGIIGMGLLILDRINSERKKVDELAHYLKQRNALINKVKNQLNDESIFKAIQINCDEFISNKKTKNNIWEIVTSAGSYLREFFNASKDVAKSFSGIFILLGIGLPVVISSGSSGFISLFTLFFLLIPCGVILETLVTNQHREQVDNHKKEIRFYNKALRRIKAKKPFTMPRPIECKKKIRIETSKQLLNSVQLMIASFSGLINGLYFGLTMNSLFFGVIFMPLASPTLPIIFAVLTGIFGFYKAYSAVQNQQDREQEALSRYDRNKNKWTKSGKSIDSVYFKTAQDEYYVEEVLYPKVLIDFIRALKNATKLFVYSFAVLGITFSSSLGLFGSFGIIPMVAIGGFSLFHAALGFLNYYWTEQRENQINRKLADANTLKKERAATNLAPLEAAVAINQHGSSHIEQYRREETIQYDSTEPFVFSETVQFRPRIRINQ